MSPQLFIPAKDLKDSISLLANVLDDEMTLFDKTKNFQWNVNGESFIELHNLFGAQNAEYERVIDKIADRMCKLGGKTIGTRSKFSTLKWLRESPDIYPIQVEMIKELLNDHLSLAQLLRKDADDLSKYSKDFGTVEFLTSMLQQHETTAWSLKRFLN